MADDLTYPTVNGVRYSFSDVSIKVAEKAFLGVKSINYKWTMKPAMVQGTHPAPLGQTRGVVEFDGSIELYQDEVNALRDALGDGFAEVEFSVYVSYDNGKRVVTDEIHNCRLADEDTSGSPGADATSRKFTLSFTDLILDGKRPYKRPLTVQN